MCLAEKMSRNPTSSLFSVLCCTRQLFNAVIYHVILLFSKSAANLIFFHEIPSISNDLLSQSANFLLLQVFMFHFVVDLVFVNPPVLRKCSKPAGLASLLEFKGIPLLLTD